MSRPDYIHGSSEVERDRLALMNRLINERCLALVKLQDETKVLDVGAGMGQFSRLMARQLPVTSRIVAVERNPEQLEAAARLAGQETACPIDFRLGDAFDLPLESREWGQFDLAHTRFLLEHVSDPLGVVKQMVQAVRPGGRLVLLDDDHDLMRFWPEPPGLNDAWTAYFNSYRELGNDPLIGRKLPELLQLAGAIPSRIDYAFYGACAGEDGFRGIVDNLWGVLDGARDTVLAAGGISASSYDRALEGLANLGSQPGASVWYVINFAEGIKPADDD